MYQGLPPAPLGSAPGRANCSLCVSPQAPPFLMPVWITFRPVPAAALPEVWLPRLLGPGNPGALAMGRPRLGWSHSRQLSNSGRLGRGRPVYKGQSPGRGCRFLPTPLTHSALSILLSGPWLYWLIPWVSMKHLLCAGPCSTC